MQLVGREGAEELLNLLEEKKIQENRAFSSAFDLFKNSPETRSNLYDAKEGSIANNEFYQDKVCSFGYGTALRTTRKTIGGKKHNNDSKSETMIGR
ncbi:unnamed protein product [Calypogeia fissa]